MKASLVFLVLVLAACADNDSSRQTAADASDGGQDRLVEAGATNPRPSPQDDIIACGEPAAPQAALVGPALAQPQVLAAAQRAPSAVAVDSQNVYWLNSQLDGGVYKIAKSGSGAIVPLFEGALISSRSLLLDETSLYFSTGSEIRAVPLVGGQGRLVASGFAADLALINGRIYWLEAQDRTTGNAVIKSVSISGGATQILGIDAKFAPIYTSNGAVGTGRDLFVSTSPGPGILRVPLDNSAQTLLPVTRPRALLSIADEVFFSTLDSIGIVSPFGGCPITLLGLMNPGGLATDGTFIYASENREDGRIVKAPTAGRSASIIVEHQRRPSALALDEVSVYWVSADEGTVKRAAK